MRFKKGRIIFAILIIIIAVLIGLMHADAANEKTIAFEDENLYIQVKDSLGDKVKSFDNNKKTITVDIDEVTSLSIFRNGVKSLNGIEQFPNLTYLSINNGDASGDTTEENLKIESTCKLEGLDKLAELPKLTELSLWYCQINDNDMQYIEKLTNLTKLDLSYNEISDVSKITNLTKLSSLILTGNKIVDINPLNKLDKISYLSINENNISDISVVAGMKEINIFLCAKNQISDISSVTNLTKLTTLDCTGNRISDISSLKSLRYLKDVSLSENAIVDFSPLMALPNLDMNDTYVTKIGKQNIEIDIKDGDIIKLPPIVKQAFQLFEPAEGVDCINCKVSDDYESCQVDSGVDGARIRISKGSMKDTIITLKPGKETESTYKLSENEKQQIREGKEAEKAIISLPKALVIFLAVLIIALWIGSIAYVCKRKTNNSVSNKEISKEQKNDNKKKDSK